MARTAELIAIELHALTQLRTAVAADINAASAKMRIHEGMDDDRYAEAETAFYDALRRYGELDREREALQAEARGLYVAATEEPRRCSRRVE